MAKFWHFGLPLTNMARKPALCELHMNHPVCTKIGLRSKIEKIFWGGGTDPSPGGRGTPSPHPSPLGPFGASILSRLRRSNLAFPQFFFKETTPDYEVGDLLLAGAACDWLLGHCA